MVSRTLDSPYSYATWVKMNALNKFQIILEMEKFFVSINYSSINIFTTWRKMLYFFTDKVFTDKELKLRGTEFG